jgi:hypothetical protein
MEPRSRRSKVSGRRFAVATAVFGGLAASIVAAVFLIEPPTRDLPGIALGSSAILVIERIAMLFAVWLLALVVIARALVGELPIEISGRGLRYADAATAHETLVDSERVFKLLREEIEELRAAIVAIEGSSADTTVKGRRYAMKGAGDARD